MSGESTLIEMVQSSSTERSVHLSALSGPGGIGSHEFRTGLHRLRRMWCGFMHNSLSWPMHGTYKCRRCGIVYTVPWRSDAEAEDRHS